MTRKRFKLSLAVLCLLTAFFMALIGLLLAPTLASAEKNSGTQHQDAEGPGGHGAPNPIYSEHTNWHEQDKVAWNAPQVGPCADKPCGNQNDDTQYSEGGPPEDSGRGSNEQKGNGGQGGQGGQGNSSDSPHNGFAGGNGGGFPGGPSGAGNPHDQVGIHTDDGDCDKSDSGKGDKEDSDKDDSNKAHCDKSDSSEGGLGASDPNGPLIQNFDSPDGPNDLPPVDPEQSADFNLNTETPPVDLVDDLPQQIPEPLTLSLFAVGLAGSVAMRRRAKVK